MKLSPADIYKAAWEALEDSENISTLEELEKEGWKCPTLIYGSQTAGSQKMTRMCRKAGFEACKFTIQGIGQGRTMMFFRPKIDPKRK